MKTNYTFSALGRLYLLMVAVFALSFTAQAQLPSGYCTDFGTFANASSESAKFIKKITTTGTTPNADIAVYSSVTTSSNRFVDKTTAKVSVRRGDTFTLTMNTNYTWWAIYYVLVDWNRNGVFDVPVHSGDGGMLTASSVSSPSECAIARRNPGDGPQESVGEYNNTGYPITVPVDAALGETRIRVFNGYAIGANGCNASKPDGSQCIVDFTLEIVEAAEPRMVTVQSSDLSMGSVSLNGSTIELSKEISGTASCVASPAAGYSFVNWTIGEVAVSSASTYLYTSNDVATVVANFAAKAHPSDMVTQFTGGGQSGRQKQWEQRYIAHAKATVEGMDQVLIEGLATNPSPVYDGTSTAYLPGALIDMTGSKIQVPAGTNSFAFYAEGVKTGANGDGLEWTNQWAFVDWAQNKDYVALSASAAETGQNLSMRDGYTRTVSIPDGTSPGVYRMYIVYNEQSSTMIPSFFSDLDAGRPKMKNGIAYAFDIEVYALTPQVLTYNGTSSEGSFVVKQGDTAVLSGTDILPSTRLSVEVTPAEGYKVLAIKVNGQPITGTTFAMPGSTTTVTVEYIAAYTFIYSFGPAELGTMTVKQGATVVSSGDKFEAGTQLTVTIDLTNPNATLKTVIFNGETLPNYTSFNVAITQESNLEVIAEVPTYTLTGSVRGNGSVLVTYTEQTTPINYGDVIAKGGELEITYTPATGETLVSSVLNGTTEITTSEYYYEHQAWFPVVGDMEIVTTFSGTGISGAEGSQAVIYAADGAIYSSEDFTIYNFASQVVATGKAGEEFRGLAAGIYIVRTASTSAKVSL